MDFGLIKSLVDYGGMFVIAIGMFIWLVRVDIPKRERRFERQQTATLVAFALDRKELLEAFKEDRASIMDKLETLNKALFRSAHTCAINRSLGMAQFLMEKDRNLTFERASLKVREHWRVNGIDLSS